MGRRARPSRIGVSEHVEFLDLEDLLRLVRALGAGPVRDVGLLDAACARPRATAFGREAYPTIHGKAAALLHSLVRNHALVDGNKRLGWLAAVVFLDVNGYLVAAADEDVFRLVMAVAEGSIDVDEITSALAGWSSASG